MESVRALVSRMEGGRRSVRRVLESARSPVVADWRVGGRKHREAQSCEVWRVDGRRRGRPLCYEVCEDGRPRERRA